MFGLPVSLEVGSFLAAIAALAVLVIPIFRARKKPKTREKWVESQKSLKALVGTHEIDSCLRAAVEQHCEQISQMTVVYAHNGGFDLKAASPLNLHWAFVQDETRLTRFGHVRRMDRSTRKAIYAAFTSSEGCFTAPFSFWELGEFKDWMQKHLISGYFVFPIGLLREMNSTTQKEIDVIVSLWVEVTGEGDESLVDYADRDSDLKDSLREVVATIKDLYEKHRSSDFSRFI